MIPLLLQSDDLHLKVMIILMILSKIPFESCDNLNSFIKKIDLFDSHDNFNGLVKEYRSI